MWSGTLVLLMISSTCLAKQIGVKAKERNKFHQVAYQPSSGHTARVTAVALVTAQPSIKEALRPRFADLLTSVRLGHHYSFKNYARIEVRCRSDTPLSLQANRIPMGVRFFVTPQKGLVCKGVGAV